VDLPTRIVTSRLSPGGGGNASTSTTSRSVSNVVGVRKRDSSYFEINGDSGELRLRMSDEDVRKFMKDKERHENTLLLSFVIGTLDWELEL
jgi:hypothetical protein